MAYTPAHSSTRSNKHTQACNIQICENYEKDKVKLV